MARQSSRASSTYSHEQQPSPELFPLEDPFTNSTLQDAQLSFESTPTYIYSNCAPSSDYFAQDFGFAEGQQIPQIYADSYFQPEYMHSLQPTLPSMGPSDGMKQDPYYTEDDLLNPFGISYAALAGMEVPLSQISSGYSSRVNTTNSLSRQYPHSR